MDLEFVALDRIPLPSLRLYAILSFFAASSSLRFFWNEAGSGRWRVGNEYNDFREEFQVFQNDKIIEEFVSGRIVSTQPSSEFDLFSSPSAAQVNVCRSEVNSSTMEFQYLQEDAIYVANYESFRSFFKSVVNNASEFDGVTWPNSSISDPVFMDGKDNFVLSWETIQWGSQQPHCVWPLVNLAYCLLILIGHAVQKTVFGNLRASEHENIKDQFWNLVFYKLVFIFGVVNVQEVEDAVGWLFFVSIVGFLQLARQLCQDRHNYLILMNDSSRRSETRRSRILALLTVMFVASVGLFLAVVGWYFGSSHDEDSFYSTKDPFEFGMPYYNFYYGGSNGQEKNKSLEGPEILLSSPYDFNLGLHSTVFMLCELGLLVIQSLHALVICIFEQMRTRTSKGKQMSEDTYTNITHNINFRFDLISLLFDLVHHVHMLVCCNLFLSMTSLIVSLQMRTRVRQIHGVLKKRQSYIWLSEHIDKYPDAVIAEGESGDDNCAICWDALSSQKAKSLPCHHIFHTSCLRKWLLVSMNCPTCRLALVNESEKKFLSTERPSRRIYTPRPVGLLGFLQTGQALLDLFGGWDPQFDDVYDEATPTATVTRPAVPLFQDFGVVQMSQAGTSSAGRRGEPAAPQKDDKESKKKTIQSES